MNKASFVSPSVEKETIESLSQKLLEVNLQLTEANRELKRVQSEKEEMLSNISHDLRAPITAIRSALDYLNSGQEISMEDYIASLQLIDRRTQTLENLIQDMYYLFCVEDTSRELELVTLEAAPFLEEYFYDMISDKRYDDHDMVLDLPENLSGYWTIFSPTPQNTPAPAAASPYKPDASASSCRSESSTMDPAFRKMPFPIFSEGPTLCHIHAPRDPLPEVVWDFLSPKLS